MYSLLQDPIDNSYAVIRKSTNSWFMYPQTEAIWIPTLHDLVSKWESGIFKEETREEEDDVLLQDYSDIHSYLAESNSRDNYIHLNHICEFSSIEDLLNKAELFI